MAHARGNCAFFKCFQQYTPLALKIDEALKERSTSGCCCYSLDVCSSSLSSFSDTPKCDFCFLHNTSRSSSQTLFTSSSRISHSLSMCRNHTPNIFVYRRRNSIPRTKNVWWWSWDCYTLREELLLYHLKHFFFGQAHLKVIESHFLELITSAYAPQEIY